MNQKYSEKTAQYLQGFIEKEGFVLLKTEYVTEDGVNYLRVFIDLTGEEREKRREKAEAEAAGKDEEQSGAVSGNEECVPEEETDGSGEGCDEPSVGINDCALISRRLSKWLDKEDFIDEEYILEVCSPGYLTEKEDD